jgi:hypothetical protein
VFRHIEHTDISEYGLNQAPCASQLRGAAERG